jgi:hypothetical protein
VGSEIELVRLVDACVAAGWLCGGRGARLVAELGLAAAEQGVWGEDSRAACAAAAPWTLASRRPALAALILPRRRDARFTTMFSALDLTGSRARWRAGTLPAASWSTQHRRCQSAPRHLIPRRVLPPARLVQKREQGNVLHAAHSGRKARGPRWSTFRQSLIMA